MSEADAFAIAARLHVVMRRTLGRVTDVEWITKNPEYAGEVIRLARAHDNAEMRDLADKLAAALAPPRQGEPVVRHVATVSAAAPPHAGARAPLPDVDVEVPLLKPAADAPRYVGRLR